MRNVLLGLLALAVLGAGAAAWFVFGAGDAEPTVDVEDVVAAPSPDGLGGEVLRYVVDQEGSSVTYAIDEVLRGVLTRVNGTTSEVATTVLLDPGDTSTLQLGEVAVNARTFETADFPARDRTVRGRILDTDDPANELITFVPTGTSDLPAEGAGAFDVEVTGDLTVSGATGEVTFPLTVTPERDGYRLAGETVVLRSEYGIEIPFTGFATDITDEVILRVDLLLVPDA